MRLEPGEIKSVGEGHREAPRECRGDQFLRAATSFVAVGERPRIGKPAPGVVAERRAADDHSPEPGALPSLPEGLASMPGDAPRGGRRSEEPCRIDAVDGRERQERADRGCSLALLEAVEVNLG